MEVVFKKGDHIDHIVNAGAKVEVSFVCLEGIGEATRG